MKVLVIGGGGREAALVWALSQSPRVSNLACAPGNAGIARWATCVPIDASKTAQLLEHACSERYDLVVVGPEAPLVEGLADQLNEAGIPVFGASAAAAEIEGSKAFSKEFMARNGLPTAAFRVFESFESAEAYLQNPDIGYPLVVKADGLAAGKGVILAQDRDEAIDAARGMLCQSSFGEAGARVVIEAMLYGREVSVFALSDGEKVIELAPCQDYKRALDGDGGLNTGGMGTYSPSAFLDEVTRKKIFAEIVTPTIQALAKEGRPYRGVLYTGLMLTDSGPQILEYNARFGDPETQVLMPRLDGDWLELLLACAKGDLGSLQPRWKSDACVCVVLAAEGYPANYPKGRPIHGLDEADQVDGVVVFHAGTGSLDGQIVTTGGRVLGVTALGSDLTQAQARAYDAVKRISWDGMQHRSDIASDAIEQLAKS